MSTSSFAEIRTEPCFVAGDYRLIWRFVTDRWQHSWERHENGIWQAVLHSTDLPDTCSPVYQELFVEERPDGEMEFQLMGQSSGIIFSAAIRCLSEPLHASFDLAVRFKTGAAPTPITAAYTTTSLSADELAATLHDLNSPRHRPGVVSVKTVSGQQFLTLIPDFETNTSPKPAAALRWGYNLFPSR